MDNQSKSNRILVNSLPKSGTHLLTQTVELFSFSDYAKTTQALHSSNPSNFDYREVKNALKQQNKQAELTTNETIPIGSLSPIEVNASIFQTWLASVPENKYIVGHIAYSPTLPSLLANLNYRHLFIIRDPRAVLPSLLSFILNPEGIPKKHFLEADLKDKSQTERLDFILNGGYAPYAGVKVKSFAEVYRSMLAWCDQPSCLAIRFEDLIGKQGGGSLEKQTKTVQAIAEYLTCDFEEVIYGLQGIYNPSSPTFRLGQIDSWMSSMDSKTIARLTAYCQPLCQDAGYET